MKLTGFKSVLFAAVAAAGLMAGAGTAADACGSAKIVFAGYSGATELVDFPALVRISEAKMPGIDLSTFRADGSDIRFFDADGNEIPHEIESWNPAGESLVWVRLPRLSGTATSVTMKWGATSPRKTDSKWVWSAYAGVWHMNDLATELPSATANGLTLSGAEAPTAVDGPVGAAVKFTKSMTAPSFLKEPWSVPTAGYAVSAWFYNPVTTPASYFVPVALGAWEKYGWYLQYQNSKTSATLVCYSGSNPGLGFSADYTAGWVHVTLVFANGKLTAYQNGVKTKGPESLSVTYKLDNPFTLTTVQYDETRVMRGVPSDDWAVADYKTQKASDFAVATEVTNPKVALQENAWSTEPSLLRETARAGHEPAIAAEPLHGTLSLTYDDARTTEVPTEIGWHTVHVGVEPTDEAYGIDAVDFRYFVRYAWAEENVGEAFVDIPANPKGITLTDYPVMLRLSTSTLAGVDMTTLADGGEDLRFYDSAGNELAHDVESFDRNGDSFIWVKVPVFGPEKQGLVMNWGKTKARTTTDADVWTGYGAVWHMTTATTIPDATGNGLDLTGTTEGSLATLSSPRGAGVNLGAAMKAGDFYAVGVPRNNHTVSFWYYYPGYSSGEGYIIDKGTWTSEGYYLFLSGADQLKLIDNKNSGRSAFGTGVNAKTAWSFVTIVHTSNHTEIYVNGVSKYSENTPDTKTTTHNLNLNPRQFDMVRVRKSATSADEIAVDYQNQQGRLSGTMSLVQNVIAEQTLIPVPAVPAEATYNDAEQRPAIPESADYTVDYGEGDYKSVGEYTITLTLTDPENTAWAGNTTAPKVFKYKILWSDNSWTATPSIDKDLWTAGESAGAIAGKSKVGQMIVRYDEARTEEMPLTPGFHVAYCSVAETSDHAGLAEKALCYRVLSAAETGSYNGDMTIRLSGYAGTTTLTNFPLLVRLSAANVAGLDMSTFGASVPKLWFYDEEGTRLKYDVERWNPAGESLVWVLVPRVKANTTRLSMQWSRSNGMRSSSAEVWGDFAAVWHMNETGVSRTDVSGHGLDLVSDQVCTQVVGKVGVATAGVGALNAPDFFAAPYSVAKADFAMSFWYRMPTHGSYEQALWNKGSYEDGGLYYAHQGDSFTRSVLVANKGLSYSDTISDCRKDWNYVTIAFVGGKVRLAVNGLEPSVENRDGRLLGAFPFVLNDSHHFDEFRIRKSAPSDDWIKADYATQSSGSFCTFSVIRNAKQSGLVIMFQ